MAYSKDKPAACLESSHELAAACWRHTDRQEEELQLKSSREETDQSASHSRLLQKNGLETKQMNDR